MDKPVEELFRVLSELPPEKVDEIAEALLKDPLLSDISPSHLSELTEYDIEKLIAIDKGECYPVFIRKFDGEILRTFSFYSSHRTSNDSKHDC